MQIIQSGVRRRYLVAKQTMALQQPRRGLPERGFIICE
jgi:hypothetical protein